MPSNKAKDNYIKRRMNCAQAVASALHEHLDIKEDALNAHSGHGAGNAPDGWCGAAYAAKKVLENKGKADKITGLEKLFLDNAGSLKCGEIRAGRKWSCVKCVEEAAKFAAMHCPKPVT
jgi:Putative redox-active protein (C_GCAxxG_C_C)